MAVTLPSRFTPSLLDVLGKDWGFQVTLVSHFNHPRELTPQSIQSLRLLKQKGITLLNQSVFLKGVNATPSTLIELFQGLYEIGVIPFYLHHPDWTPGTFHFRLSIEEGKQIISQIRGQLAGPSMPHYILDIPQGYGKAPIFDPHFKKVADFPAEKLHTGTDRGTLAGAVYEIPAPAIRNPQQTRYFYLDLFPT
jgi:lysine 2,3-aminomutase